MNFNDLFILWATPSAAGPRSLLIALGLQIFGIVASGSWHLWYPDLSFGMLGGLTFGVLGALGRSWDTGEHKKGHFEVHAWIFINFWIIWGSHVERFLRTLDQKPIFITFVALEIGMKFVRFSG